MVKGPLETSFEIYNRTYFTVSLDMMIAAHAKSIGGVLFTRDRAFSLIGNDLQLQNWTT
jgi:predicted nucleic acid-binding protein